MQIKSDEDPFKLFSNWLEEAKKSEINDPEAMAFSTVSKENMPSVRMVLLRKFDERGFVFFTNYNSRKSKEIIHNNNGGLCIHWKSLRRQVRAVGKVKKISDYESDEYYNSRHLGSRIGAWASKQSEQLENRQILSDRVAKFKEKFSKELPPRPDFWGGFRLNPNEIEFWSDGEYRLHDRFKFEFIQQEWKVQRLYP